jgi:hypothetical protein
MKRSPIEPDYSEASHDSLVLFCQSHEHETGRNEDRTFEFRGILIPERRVSQGYSKLETSSLSNIFLL